MAKGRERTVKWYFKNEKEVMNDLGLTPTPGSGSNWVAKEDGENDYVLAQLKSTDKQSYKLNLLDLQKLEHNAMVANKIPMFILQFLQDDSRYALISIDDIPLIAQYIKTGEIPERLREAPMVLEEDVKHNVANKRRSKPKIKSSANAREQFFKEKEQAWENKKYFDRNR